jgi:retron-type reverse transcriptase
METPIETPTNEVCRIKVSELQRRLATKATESPEHRFTKLYDLLIWEPLMAWAFDTLMTNRGSRTAGIDGMDKRIAIGNKEEILANLRTALKAGTFEPQPVRRVSIAARCVPEIAASVCTTIKNVEGVKILDLWGLQKL